MVHSYRARGWATGIRVALSGSWLLRFGVVEGFSVSFWLVGLALPSSAAGVASTYMAGLAGVALASVVGVKVWPSVRRRWWRSLREKMIDACRHNAANEVPVHAFVNGVLDAAANDLRRAGFYPTTPGPTPGTVPPGSPGRIRRPANPHGSYKARL